MPSTLSITSLPRWPGQHFEIEAHGSGPAALAICTVIQEMFIQDFFVFVIFMVFNFLYWNLMYKHIKFLI